MKFTYVSILVLSTNIGFAWLSARNHAVRSPQRVSAVRLSSSSLVEGPIHPASASDVVRDKLLSDANRAAWEQMVAKGAKRMEDNGNLTPKTTKRKCEPPSPTDFTCITAQEVTEAHLYKNMQDPMFRGPLWIKHEIHQTFFAEMEYERTKPGKYHGRYWFPTDLSAAAPESVYERKEQPIVQFYEELLHSTDEKSTALLIDLAQLSDLKRLFPQVRVQRYETNYDFFVRKNNHETMCRRQYDRFLVLCNDHELWQRTEPIQLTTTTTTGTTTSTTATAASSNKPCVVDCIIYTQGPCAKVMSLLSGRMYKESLGEPGFWTTPGYRVDEPVTSNPSFVLTDYGFHTYRFPVQERTTAEQLERAGQSAEYYQQLGEYLQKHAGGCGWFTGSFQFQYLAFQDPGDGPNLLVRPGTEHEHVLPMSNEQLLQRIDSGDVTSGKVVICDSKGNKYASFRQGIEAEYSFDPKLSYDEMRSRHYCRPETEEVVFYCNHASSSSPAAAEYHWKWLQEHHPGRQQLVYVLQGGMAGMVRHLKAIGKVDEYLVNVSGGW